MLIIKFESIRTKFSGIPFLLACITFIVSPILQADSEFVEDDEYLVNYALSMIHASAAYERGITGKGVTVGVLDTGVNITHYELQNADINGYDFGLDTDDLTFADYHGTAVSSIIAGQRNGYAMQGVAYDAALEVAAGTGGDIFDATPIINSLSYLIGRDVPIINNSWELPFFTITDFTGRDELEGFINDFGYTEVLDAFRTAVENDIIIVFSAGNSGFGELSVTAGLPYYFPELQPNWIAVTAVDQYGEFAGYNACGVSAAFCVAAPGDLIITPDGTNPPNGFLYFGATSAAAPFVSALAALLKQEFPWMTGEQIVSTILTTASNGTDAVLSPITGRGLIDVARAIDGPAAFEFEFNADTQGHDAVFANAISGSGSLVKTGEGTLALTGLNSYSGTTTVSGGTLFVDGSILNSTSTVNPGGTLGGTGTLGNVNVAGGTIAPGKSIGVMAVAGSLDFSSGGIYQVEVNADGDSDQINVTGTANLTGGSVQVITLTDIRNASTDYTILIATDGQEGTFDGVTTSHALLIPALIYDGSNVVLNLTVDFKNLAPGATPNQVNLLDALTSIYTSGTEKLDRMFDELLTLDSDSLRQVLDGLSGVQHTNNQGLISNHNYNFLHILNSRAVFQNNTKLTFNPMAGQLLVYNGNDWPVLAVAAPIPDKPDKDGAGRGWWLQGFGGFGEVDDTTNATGANHRTAGVAAGIDTDWNDWLAGVAASYANSDADTFNGNMDVDSFQFAIYGNWRENDIYVNAISGVGYHDTNANRLIALGNLTTAAAAYGSYQVNVSTEAGKSFSINPATALTPYVGMEYTHTRRDSFTETGAGLFNLAVQGNAQDSLRTQLGLRLNHSLTFSTGSEVMTFIYGAYVREHLDRVALMDAGFSIVPGNTFRIDGVVLDRNRAQVGAGLMGYVNESMTYHINYDSKFAGSDDNHSFSATLRFRW